MSTAWRDKKGWYAKYYRDSKKFLERNRAENGGRCTLQLEGVCTGTAQQVHHVLGINVNKLDQKYWAAACRACNNKIGDPRKHNPPHPTTTLFD